jgi:hypothetical protein
VPEPLQVPEIVNVLDIPFAINVLTPDCNGKDSVEVTGPEAVPPPPPPQPLINAIEIDIANNLLFNMISPLLQINGMPLAALKG